MSILVPMAARDFARLLFRLPEALDPPPMPLTNRLETMRELLALANDLVQGSEKLTSEERWKALVQVDDLLSLLLGSILSLQRELEPSVSFARSERKRVA
jgi:hypothetical protein